MVENQNMEEPKEEPRSLSCNKCNYQMDELDELNLYVYRTNMAPLLSHIRRIHLGYQPYLCSHCPAVFPTLTDIDHHIEVFHDGHFKVTSRRDADVERQADEDLCRILAGNGDLQDQNQNSQATAKKNGLFCSDCNYRLEHSKDEDARMELVKMDPLVSHIRRFHFGYQPFKCGHCPGVFPTLLDIERHVECAHKGEWKVSSNRNRDIESEVKRMLVTDHRMPDPVFIINNPVMDDPRPAVRFNDSDNADQAQNDTADQGMDMRLQRCISAPPNVHNSQVAESNEERPVPFGGLSELMLPDRSRGSRPRVGKYKEFIQTLSRRGLPRMPARPRRLTSARQAAIFARNVQTSSHHDRFVTPIKPSSTALKTCFDDDFEGVTMIQNRMILMKCPKCDKICKPHGMATHLRHLHKLTQSEHNEFFASCKKCGASVYRQVALIHANACEKQRGSCNRQKRKQATVSPKKRGPPATPLNRQQGTQKLRRIGADSSIMMEARQQNGNISASGRSFRSESRNNSAVIQNGTVASTSHQNASTSSVTTPPTRQLKKELNLGYDDEDMSSENGGGSFWDFSNQD